MPFCPRCHYEYKSGLSHCPDCDVELVEKLMSEPVLLPAGPLVTVYLATDMAEANLVKSLLEEAQIEAFIGYDLGPAYPVGQIEVRIAATRADEARELIAEFLRARADGEDEIL